MNWNSWIHTYFSMTMHINSHMHTIFKVFRPTAPAGRTPLGPCSNTAPSSLRMELNQPPHLPDLSNSTIYISRGGVWCTVLKEICYYFDFKCVLTFTFNVGMKAYLLNHKFTLKTDYSFSSNDLCWFINDYKLARSQSFKAALNHEKCIRERVLF